MSEQYNGWTNWETWECHNVIDSVADVYQAASRCIDANELTQYMLAEFVLEGHIGSIDCPGEFAVINFNEIFDTLNVALG